MKPAIIVLSYVIVLNMPFVAHAHGVVGAIQNGGLAVTATYDSGEAMSYAKVTITAPAADFPFQSGRTDRNGRFCFFPDTPGQWKVVVNDEIGHRLEIDVPVNKQLACKQDQNSPDDRETDHSRYDKALMGICIVFGVFGIFSWFMRRKGRTAL